MCFDPEKDNIKSADSCECAGNLGARFKFPRGVLHPHAMLLHGLKMCAAGKKSYVETRASHQCAKVSSDGAGSRNQESHPCSSKTAVATARRRILPVPVVGMLSTK